MAEAPSSVRCYGLAVGVGEGVVADVVLEI
jgi:hypothetical protein